MYREKHDMYLRSFFVQNIRNSHEISLLMSYKMLLNCTEIAYIDTNDKMSFLAIPITQVKPYKNSFAKKKEYVYTFSKGEL